MDTVDRFWLFDFLKQVLAKFHYFNLVVGIDQKGWHALFDQTSLKPKQLSHVQVVAFEMLPFAAFSLLTEFDFVVKSFAVTVGHS